MSDLMPEASQKTCEEWNALFRCQSQQSPPASADFTELIRRVQADTFRAAAEAWSDPTLKANAEVESKGREGFVDGAEFASEWIFQYIRTAAEQV